MITKKIDEYLTEANKYNLYDDEDISKEEVKDAEKALAEYEKNLKALKVSLQSLKPEFKNLLKEESKELGEQHGLNLSTHAAKRLRERNLEMDTEEFFKLRGAVDKLKSKGGKDSLIITDKAAYIVDVNKNTIVTAVDKNNLMENVFTKIDSTMIVS